MTTRKKKSLVVIIVAAIIAAIVVAVALGQPKPPAAQATPATSDTVSVTDADKAKLAAQVKITDDDVLRVKTDYIKKWGTAYLDSSMPWRAKDRKFSDAVSLPFAKNDVNGAWEELRKEVFLNPVHRYMVLKELSEVSWITQDNPWIADYLTKYDANGALYWVADADFKAQTDESIIFGIKSVLLLEKFKTIDIVELPSTKNWHLNTATEPSKVKPEINKDYQEDKPVLRIAFVWKNDQHVLQYGFNMLDKRMEILGEKKKEEKKQDTPASTPNPSTPGTPSTPDEPGGKEPTPTPTPTPDYDKDPDDDPVNNGNADRGGGQNQPSDGSGPAEVQDPATVPTQGHQDPATTYPETPAQDSSHQNTHVDNTNESQMNYESKPDPAQTWTNPDTGQSTTYTAPPTGQSSTSGSTAHGEFTPDI